MQDFGLISYYKAIEAKSTEMLNAALRQDWDEVVECEKSCSVLISELRVNAVHSGLSPALRKEKTRIMQNILRNDAQIRVLAEPWLATLEHMGRSHVSSVLH